MVQLGDIAEGIAGVIEDPLYPNPRYAWSYALRYPQAASWRVKDRTATCRLLKPFAERGRLFTGPVAGERGAISAYFTRRETALAVAAEVFVATGHPAVLEYHCDGEGEQ